MPPQVLRGTEAGTREAEAGAWWNRHCGPAVLRRHLPQPVGRRLSPKVRRPHVPPGVHGVAGRRIPTVDTAVERLLRGVQPAARRPLQAVPPVAGPVHGGPAPGLHPVRAASAETLGRGRVPFPRMVATRTTRTPARTPGPKSNDGNHAPTFPCP